MEGRCDLGLLSSELGQVPSFDLGQVQGHLLHHLGEGEGVVGRGVVVGVPVLVASALLIKSSSVGCFSLLPAFLVILGDSYL